MLLTYYVYVTGSPLHLRVRWISNSTHWTDSSARWELQAVSKVAFTLGCQLSIWKMDFTLSFIMFYLMCHLSFWTGVGRHIEEGILF